MKTWMLAPTFSAKTVNSKGKVVAKKKGRATVTVTTRDGRKTAGCTIIVK